MTQLIQAIYEQGVFRPLEPVELAEHAHVALVVSPFGAEKDTEAQSEPSAILQRQKAALAKLRVEMDSLPSCAPKDGLGGADHDLILYGWRK
jgi:predicted DNA-binding antitoxin AbrB/MazE fold protein